MLAMPTPSSTAEDITRSIEGSPMLTKNSEIPTTSMQIRNDMTGVRRPADARGEAEAGVTSQNRDHHRERDEIGIVSFEHDRLGRPSPRACLLPPPSLQVRRRE